MSWRDTLFIWRGSAKCTKGVLEWKGSWVGVESRAAKDVKVPPKARFSKSNMLFLVNGEQDVQGESIKKGSCAEAGTELIFKVTKGKGWLLDDMLYHKDHTHDVLFVGSNEAATVLVGAMGSNDFGSFLSLGKCDGVASIAEIKAGKEFTLILGRRYLEEEDVRSSWKVNIEIKECLERFSFPKEGLNHNTIFQSPNLDTAPTLKTTENAKKRKGTKVIAEHQTSKRMKMEDREEIMDTVYLGWKVYNNETCTYENHSANIDEIRCVHVTLDGTEPGENNERSLSLSLTWDGKTLAKINFDWWDDRDGATLMHFHQSRQDLAEFCMELWAAAGRNTADYCDMAVEFGESRYSHVKVSRLIEEALGCGLAPEILYVDSANGSDKEALSRLYQHMARVFDEAHIISHQTDNPPGWSKIGMGWRVRGVIDGDDTVEDVTNECRKKEKEENTVNLL